MKVLDSLEKYILLATLFLLPVVFLPIFPNAFDTPKIAVLTTGIGLAIIIKAVKTIVKGTWETTSGSFDLPVILLALAYFLSAIFKTQSKMDAFFLPGTATIILGGGVLYLLLNSLAAQDKKALSVTIFTSGTVAALLSLIIFSGILNKFAFIPAFLKDPAFNTLGGALPATIFFGVIMFLGLGMVLSEKEFVKKALAATATLIVVLGFAINFLNILPGKATAPSLPPFKASWEVAVETLKESPLLGIGSGNYLTAFNRFRTVTYNATKLWPVRFIGGADFPLTILTETGLLGLTAFLILLFSVGKLTLKQIKSFNGKRLDFVEISYLATLLTSVIIILLLPINLTLIVLTFALLSLNGPVRKNDINLIAASRILPFIIGLPLIAAFGVFFYFGGRALAAEYQFNQGLTALTKNDGKGTYDLLRSAITLNPYVDRYHATFAQINLALAGSLAQKKDLSDNDKNTIAQLIQQAINEGKAIVTLNPQRSGNWELLARTYQSIMPFAQESDNFAIQTYTQAIALDPINPNLRIALGGIYYALGRYDEAIDAFKLAVLAKPDLANAHYNLAAAYREKGNIDKAITEMNTVLTQVAKDSADYNLAKTELESLQEKLPTVKTTEVTGESLTPPAVAPTQVIKPPLELPKEATPPATGQ